MIFATEVDSNDADLRPVVEAVRKTEGIAYATQPRISKDGQAATFMAFPGPDVSVKPIGLGVAVAVLIDATIVRMILVPAVIELWGKANWWMPGRRAPKATPASQARVGEEARVCLTLFESGSLWLVNQEAYREDQGHKCTEHGSLVAASEPAAVHGP